MAFYCVTKTQVDPASNLSQAGFFFFVLCFPSLSRLPVLSKSFDCLQCLPAVGALPLLTQFRREGWSVHYWFPDRPAPSFTLFFFLSAFSLDRSAPSLFVSSLPPNWENDERSFVHHHWKQRERAACDVRPLFWKRARFSPGTIGRNVRYVFAAVEQ